VRDAKADRAERDRHDHARDERKRGLANGKGS
jgi:hypothetical protein